MPKQLSKFDLKEIPEDERKDYYVFHESECAIKEILIAQLADSLDMLMLICIRHPGTAMQVLSMKQENQQCLQEALSTANTIKSLVSKTIAGAMPTGIILTEPEAFQQERERVIAAMHAEAKKNIQRIISTVKLGVEPPRGRA